MMTLSRRTRPLRMDVVTDPERGQAGPCAPLRGRWPSIRREKTRVAAILKATGGLGVDVVFVAAAAPGVLEQAVNVCRRMGRLVIIASFFTGGGVEARVIQAREQAVLGTSMYTGVEYRMAIRLWEQGRLDRSHPSSRSASGSTRRRRRWHPGGRKLPDNIKTIIRFD